MKFRRIRPDDPAAGEVESMVDENFGYYGGPYWAWKFSHPKGPDAIIVASEQQGRVVGCAHYLPVDYHLGPHREIDALMAGDLFVNEDLRRKGVATDLSISARAIASEASPEAAVVAMFTWRALGTHYERLLGYTRVRPSFDVWTKRLDWSDKLDAIAIENQGIRARHGRLAQVDHFFVLGIGGAPPLIFHVHADGFNPVGAAIGPPVRVRIESPGSIGGSGGIQGAMSILTELVRGRLRVSGHPRAFLEAVRVSRAYREVIGALRD